MNVREYYGAHRVLSPQGLLPQAADKIDNNPKLWPSEILIEVKVLQLTSTAVRSIYEKCGREIEAVKAEVLRIVEDRGKFQDPVTKSGGMLIGTVKQIGEARKGETDLAVGDTIATLVSLSLTPLKIYEIYDFNPDTEQLTCRADAVLFESGIYSKIPADLGEKLSLAVMDIAGAPAQVAINVKPGDLVAVMGAGKAGLLCLAEAKKRVSPTGKVICLEYDEKQCKLVTELGIADEVIQINGQKPLETYELFLTATGGVLADFTVNCVNAPDTELSSILITKDSGKIYFFSMSTNFAKASLGAEGAKKYVTMVLGAGYYPGHAEIAYGIVRENPKLRAYLDMRYR
ncbi:MAG: L-erythro-3,5-diaminohexanoate dehydrogenase [Clostridiales Family XIII bacterium]|nr:L-erythro-3,5-diaminohexanoate dehydrogenase [Clostridiales Family XIII bacterium]